MPITFKTVITKAIKGFNDIQDTLATFNKLSVSGVSKEGTEVKGSLTPESLKEEIMKLNTLVVNNEIITTFAGRNIPVFLGEDGEIEDTSGSGNSGECQCIRVVSELPTASEEENGNAVVYKGDIFVCVEED